MATTSAERMRRLREKRAEQMMVGTDIDLRTLSDTALLDRMALALRQNLPLDVRELAAEAYRRAQTRREAMASPQSQ